MTDQEYIDTFTEGVKSAHESLMPLLKAFADVMMAYEARLAPGERCEVLEKLYKELETKELGASANEDENLN